ncbi:hypothetical protein LZZ85_26915, partial [Terrimonas sp. NA20]
MKTLEDQAGYFACVNYRSQSVIELSVKQFSFTSIIIQVNLKTKSKKLPSPPGRDSGNSGRGHESAGELRPAPPVSRVYSIPSLTQLWRSPGTLKSLNQMVRVGRYTVHYEPAK